MRDLTQDEFAYLCTNHCVFCGGDELLEGPHGGLSVNYYCGNGECGARFNVMGPLGAQIIRESHWIGNPPIIKQSRGGRFMRLLKGIR